MTELFIPFRYVSKLMWSVSIQMLNKLKLFPPSLKNTQQRNADKNKTNETNVL